MSDGEHSAAGAGQARELLDGAVLVVRTIDGWGLTLADERDPRPLSDAALHALVRASGGVVLAADDPARAELEAAGLVLPADGDRAPVGPAGTSPDGSEAEWVALPPDSPAFPVAVFVAAVAAGHLAVEGRAGDQVLLDDVDLHLVEALRPGGTAGSTLAEVRRVLGAACPADTELGGRLRRLAATGRVELHEDHAAAVAALLAPPPAVPEPEPVPATSLGLKAELKRVDFPGRPVARKGWRALRKVRRAVRGATPASAGPSAPVAADGPPVAAPEPVAPVAAEAPAFAEVEPTDAGAPTWDAPGQVTYAEPAFVGEAPEGAVPVYSVFMVDNGPCLSLGMLLATARSYQDGAVNERCELRRVEDPATFFADLETREGPAVLLLSNYTWSVEHNFEVARRAREINPEIVIVHGGPSTPKYEDDCAAWFAAKGDLVDVAVRGEGEITLAEMLLALTDGGGADLARLEAVEGLTFRHPADGRIVRTADRDRVTDLDSLPSPYLTGEFDHLTADAWSSGKQLVALILETNRGCPYGCTFCDWGSSTLSRIRKFDLERVEAEMTWAASMGLQYWVLADANYGIMSRDVDVTKLLVSVKEKCGAPHSLGFNVAKNTTKHLTTIIDHLVAANVIPHFTLALQTRDEATLEAVRRTNISSDHYVALAAAFRRRGLPIQADLMICLPGQTVDSLTGDLQFCIDHEIPARMWITQLLPNAPLNDPEYRDEWAIQGDDRHLLISTASFTAEDREEMLRIRAAYTIFERFGVLRHVLRMIQWDHGVETMAVMRRLIDVSRSDPTRYPLLNWTVRYFDYFNAPPLGWRSFYDEVRRFLSAEFDVPLTGSLESVLAVQAALMPDHGRSFPQTVVLDHDYLAYYRANTHELWASGHAEPGARPLTDYGPGTLTVYADPLHRCTDGLQAYADPRNETMVDDFWLSGQWELDSPLVRAYAEVSAEGSFIGLHEQRPDDLPEDIDTPKDPTDNVRIRIGRKASTDGTDVGEDLTADAAAPVGESHPA